MKSFNLGSQGSPVHEHGDTLREVHRYTRRIGQVSGACHWLTGRVASGVIEAVRLSQKVLCHAEAVVLLHEVVSMNRHTFGVGLVLAQHRISDHRILAAVPYTCLDH